jgi:chemotaxis protein methyltransferase CheR
MNHDQIAAKDGLNSQFAAYIKGHEQAYIQLIQHRLGIVIKTHQTNELRAVILSACHQFHCTPEEYIHLLKNSADHAPLLEHLILAVTIGETYFFRDNHQMELLQEKVLPTLIASKKTKGDLSLRIWSAGCASGEEIYTIAMLLNESLMDINRWTINLLATDINMSSLQKGMEGIYAEWSMRSIPLYFKQRYFTVLKNKYHLNPEIRDLAHFNYLNLNDDIYPSIFNETNAQDLILCRNVLIYFDQICIDKLMKRLSACLLPDGFLLLGASDPVNIKETNLASYNRESSLFIRKSVQATHKLPFAAPVQN